MASKEDNAMVIPDKIRTACTSALACESKAQRKDDRRRETGREEKRVWEDHFPREVVENLMVILEGVKPHCNKAATDLIDVLIMKKPLWLDKESSPRKWAEFRELVTKLSTLPFYIY